MIDTITIRKATIEDASLLSTLGRKTFEDAFSKDNKPSDMAMYLDKTFTTEQLQKELSEKDAVFFIAEIDHDAIGYAKIKVSEKPHLLDALNPIEIERLYAMQNFIGKGVGKLLMETCIEYAKQHGHDFIWLGAWELNPRAIAFYEKFGYRKFNSRKFLLGTDLQNDFMMAKQLN